MSTNILHPLYTLNNVQSIDSHLKQDYKDFTSSTSCNKWINYKIFIKPPPFLLSVTVWYLAQLLIISLRNVKLLNGVCSCVFS